MTRDILSEYGRDSGVGQNAPAARGGGEQTPRGMMNYSSPVGPTNIMDPKSPGLHGDNCGNCGSQGYTGETHKQTSGSPGNHGTNHGMGTNRRG